MISCRITNHLLYKFLLCNSYLEFTSFRDSQTAVMMLHQDVIRAKKKKKFVIGISLGLKAAYDSVYIDGLIMKCAQLGISSRMLLWLHRFLTIRNIKVLWRGV